jgi:hypothetical protein
MVYTTEIKRRAADGYNGPQCSEDRTLGLAAHYAADCVC